MKFSSRQVNAEIKRKVWPALRAAGFGKTNARNAWRNATDTIAVVNFQSFNSYHAAGLGCTSFSFCVNLGVYYLCVHKTPWASKWPDRYGVPPIEPAEYCCHARLHLEKLLFQPEFPRLDIWYVRLDGSNLDAVIDDARRVILDVGLPWLEKFTSLPYALAEYQRPHEYNREDDVCALGTLNGAEEGSAIALALKDFETATALWQSVVDSEYYTRFPDALEKARSILSLIGEEQVKAVKAIK